MEQDLHIERVGRYRILRRLSRGGMGVVYLGVAEGIGGFERLAAIKMLNPEHRDNQQYTSMFLDEARIGARIQHPNLVAVQEIGEHEGELFIAMDYVHGETLGKIIKRHDRRGRAIPVPYLLEVGIAIADALQAMHKGGVIHGDVSPQNVLVGYDGTVRVTDFGVSQTEDNLFQASSAVLRGKIGYLAPEQLVGETQTFRSDIYSLGIVLWEACTGRRLFATVAKPALAAAQRLALMDGIVRPDSVRADLPPGLSDIILRALAPEAADRFTDARSLGNALRAVQMECDRGVGSPAFEDYMHDLFADRIAIRTLSGRTKGASISTTVSDEELSQLHLATLEITPAIEVPAIQPPRAAAPPIAVPPAPIAPQVSLFQAPEVPDHDETDSGWEVVTGAYVPTGRGRLGLIPLAAGLTAIIAVFLLSEPASAPPTNEKPPAAVEPKRQDPEKPGRSCIPPPAEARAERRKT